MGLSRPARRAFQTRSGYRRRGVSGSQRVVLQEGLERLLHEPLEVPVGQFQGEGVGGGVAVRDQTLQIDSKPNPQPLALGAGAETAVEGEAARLQLRHADSTADAGGPLREEEVGSAPGREGHQPFGHLDGVLDRVTDSAPGLFQNLQPVHDDLHRVVLPLVQLRRFLQVLHVPVHARPQVSLPPVPFEQLLELALPVPDQGRQDHAPFPGRVRQDLRDDLIHRLAGDRAVAARATGRADAGEEEAEVVVDFGDGPHGGAGAPGGGLLLDGDGGGQPLDGVHVRLLHLLQELAGVGGERFDVAPLSLGVEGVEGQARLPGAAETGDDGDPVPGEVQIDVLEIVLAGAADGEGVCHCGLEMCWGVFCSSRFLFVRILVGRSVLSLVGRGDILVALFRALGEIEARRLDVLVLFFEGRSVPSLVFALGGEDERRRVETMRPLGFSRMRGRKTASRTTPLLPLRGRRLETAAPLLQGSRRR